MRALLFTAVMVPYENSNLVAARERQNPVVAAIVAGQEISYDELVRPVASRIYDLQQQIYHLERDLLDQLVAKMVLEKEAERQGKPLQELIKGYIGAQNIACGRPGG